MEEEYPVLQRKTRQSIYTLDNKEIVERKFPTIRIKNGGSYRSDIHHFPSNPVFARSTWNSPIF